MDSKKLDEALVTVRAGVAEIERMKAAADNFVKEREAAVATLNAEIEQKRKTLAAIEKRIEDALRTEQEKTAILRKAAAALENALKAV